MMAYSQPETTYIWYWSHLLRVACLLVNGGYIVKTVHVLVICSLHCSSYL